MIKAKPSSTQSWSIGAGVSYWDPKYSPDQTYRTGCVLTPHGIVRVFTHYGSHSFTDMHFVHNGKRHVRFWKRYFSLRSCATLAKQFAKEIVAP